MAEIEIKLPRLDEVPFPQDEPAKGGSVAHHQSVASRIEHTDPRQAPPTPLPRVSPARERLDGGSA
jgi:hypothetical protein